MRLGLLGPAGSKVGALGRAAEFLLNGARVHRAIYLGNDGALDRVVAAWARKLVGDDPSDETAWHRAAEIASTGTPEAIDRFVGTERARLRLKALEALPEPTWRTIESIGDWRAVLVHDGSLIEEEDLLAAGLLVFGKSAGPSLRKVGARWFLTPGPIGSSDGGIVIVDHDPHEIAVTTFDSTGTLKHREVITPDLSSTCLLIHGDAQ